MATSMFENYQYIPEGYTPNNVRYNAVVPQQVKYPLVSYNKFDEPIGFTWNYGDSIYLEFNTTGNVVYDELGYTEDAEMYLQGKKFKLNVYNVRGEVCAQCECDARTQVRILSDSFYPDSLVKGVYHLQLTLIDEDNNILTTLLGWDDCIIYIK